MQSLTAWSWVALASLVSLSIEGASATACSDAASCKDKLQKLQERLHSTQDRMKSRKQTMQALEGLREGLLTGKRVPMPSAQKHHLEKGTPLIGQITYDAKHAPVSTNVSKALRHIRTVAGGSNVQQYALMPVKRPVSTDAKIWDGSALLIATVEDNSKLHLRSPDGESRLSSFDLGHRVKHMSVSSSPDYSYILTGDETHELRATFVELSATNASSAESGDSKSRPKKELKATANTTATFPLPQYSSGDRRTTAVLVVDRGSQPYFVAGDNLGSVVVFFKNGTLKGRIKVTEDAGGVRGLLRAQGQQVLFYSSHSFGFVSLAQVDVSTPPCTGWNSPVFDIAPDPQSSYNRVILSLSDGDVLVFTTVSGKNKEKTCDLTMKFPRVASLPFRLHSARGHAIGLPTPSESTKQPQDYNRDLYFFNMAAMETGSGFGSSGSRNVALQASFEPRQLQGFDMLSTSVGSSSSMSSSSTSKTHIALRFGEGIELYELTLKTASASLGGGGGGSGGSSDGGGGFASWLDWIPKFGIFGMTLIGVVIWNIRKVTGSKQNQSSAGGGGLEGLDGLDDDFLQKLREKKRNKAASDKKTGGDDDFSMPDLPSRGADKAPDVSGLSDSLGSLGDLGLGGVGDLKDQLGAMRAEMDQLRASMPAGFDD